MRTLNRRQLFLTSLLLAAVSVASGLDRRSPAAHAAVEDPLHLVVLHTNDLHGQVAPRPATWLEDADPKPLCGGLARLAAALWREKRRALAEGAAVLVVDSGDWFQGTPEGRLDQGRAFLAALTLLGYDAMAVGNHEFDHGPLVLEGHLAAVRPPALLANVSLPEGGALPGTKPYRIVERGGLRIALVGLCTTETPSITDPSARELVWREPSEVLTRYEKELDVDWILPLTHCGVAEDRALARAHPELPLIVGGHSHSFLRKGLREGSTLIVQTGAKASTLGRVDLYFDRESGRVVESHARLIDLYQEPAAEDRVGPVEAACAAMHERADGEMNVVVGELTAPLTRSSDPFTSSPAGNLVTDAMRAHSGADVALQNRGGLRANLPAGPLTRRHLFQLLPFDNHLVTLTMTGTELLRLMHTAVEERGGRGLEFSGMTVLLSGGKGRPKLVGLLVGGKPLDPERDYRVTVNSFNAEGGDGYEFLASLQRRESDPILLRDVLEEYLAGGRVTPPTERRYRRSQ